MEIDRSPTVNKDVTRIVRLACQWRYAVTESDGRLVLSINAAAAADISRRVSMRRLYTRCDAHTSYIVSG